MNKPPKQNLNQRLISAARAAKFSPKGLEAVMPADLVPFFQKNPVMALLFMINNVYQWGSDIEGDINELEAGGAPAAPGLTAKLRLEVDERLTIGYRSIDQMLPSLPPDDQPLSLMEQVAFCLAVSRASLEWMRQLESILKIIEVGKEPGGETDG